MNFRRVFGVLNDEGCVFEKCIFFYKVMRLRSRRWIVCEVIFLVYVFEYMVWVVFEIGGIIRMWNFSGRSRLLEIKSFVFLGG